MKKTVCLGLLALASIASPAQTPDVETLCCQNVDFYLMATSAAAINAETTMADLSLQTPKLTTIPAEVMRAPNLTYLNVSFNRVGTIPESLAKLTKLACLDLSGNHYLTTLPAFLGQMPSLKVIKLTGLSWPKEKQEAVRKQFPGIKFIF